MPPRRGLCPRILRPTGPFWCAEESGGTAPGVGAVGHPCDHQRTRRSRFAPVRGCRTFPRVTAPPSPVPFAAARIDHAAVVVTDVARAVAFYRDVLGLTEVPRPPTFDFPGAWLRVGPAGPGEQT